jgi:hypothetical protein
MTFVSYPILRRFSETVLQVILVGHKETTRQPRAKLKLYAALS